MTDPRHELLTDPMAGPTIRVTVRDVWGSAPREAGAWMLVTEAGIAGTIGGGNLEWRAIEAARDMLASGACERELALPLGPALTQCCGGQVRLELTSLDGPLREKSLAELAAVPARWPLVALFGAGHVGRAVIRALAPLPCRLRWIDSRPDAFPPLPERDIELIRADEPSTEVAALPAGAFALVMTHSHPLDLSVVEACLRRSDLAWIGLIGSATKRRRFESQLRASGIPSAELERLVCPIGIQGITDKEPSVIAIAVAAQLLIAFEAHAALSRRLEGVA
jgi:xanthine dehydrogenase accessory factor